MTKITEIKPCVNAQETLRRIAKLMDSGKINCSSVTIIAGQDVFQCGEFNDDDAVVNAVYNMNFGIAKLMKAELSEIEGWC